MDLGTGEETAEFLLGDGSEETTPQDLLTSETVFSIQFHPTAPFLAVGLVSGAVEIHEFRRTETRPLASIPTHSGGITAMEFTANGSHLATVSSDRHIKVLDCQAQQHVIDIKKKNNPHKAGICSVNICTDTLVATGDDDGQIVLWDMRQQGPVQKYHEHGDFVSQIIYFAENQHLISSSGDTCLGAWDVRANGMIQFSDRRKDDLTCMAFLPATNDIVCGTPTGALPIWRYGSWSRPFDVHSKHPKECDAILTFNDNMFLTGAGDGMVRIVQHHPVRRVLTHLAAHERRKFGITQMTLSHDRTLLAVAGTERFIQFVDVEFLGDEKELDKLRSKAEQRHLQTLKEATASEDARKARAARLQMQETVGDESDDSEWEDDSSADDDSDDDSDGEVPFVDPLEEEEVLDRKTKRARVAASQWLKTAQKQNVNFEFEKRKKRLKGFWGDL